MGRARRRRRNPPSGISLKMVAAGAVLAGLAYAAYRWFFGAPASSAASTAEVAKTIYALQQQAANLDASGLPALQAQASALRSQAAAIAAANPAAKSLVALALQSSGKA